MNPRDSRWVFETASLVAHAFLTYSCEYIAYSPIKKSSASFSYVQGNEKYSYHTIQCITIEYGKDISEILI